MWLITGNQNHGKQNPKAKLWIRGDYLKFFDIHLKVIVKKTHLLPCWWVGAGVNVTVIDSQSSDSFTLDDVWPSFLAVFVPDLISSDGSS